MRTKTLLPFVAVIALSAFGEAVAQEASTTRVQFKSGQDNAVLTGKVTGRELVLYKLSAREGQFLSVSLRPDNPTANYNIYIPGRGPGDEALYISATGGREYNGQLYKTGEHTISVCLIPAAARRGEVANYDIVFRITDKPAGRLPAEVPPTASATPAVSTGLPWDKVTMTKADHAPLLQRQAAFVGDLARTPVAVALLVLEPDLLGIVTEVSAKYDTMESPAEVGITVTEGGILDDDLFGVRHVVSLARNRNDEWRIVGYARGELRRTHLR